MRFIGQKDAFMPLHYFKELSPDEHNNLDVIVNSYSHNFRIKFVRLVAIEILNADVNAKNSGEFVSVPPSTLASVKKNDDEEWDSEKNIWRSEYDQID